MYLEKSQNQETCIKFEKAFEIGRSGPTIFGYSVLEVDDKLVQVDAWEVIWLGMLQQLQISDKKVEITINLNDIQNYWKYFR